ncbi:iron-sulfur cluster repair di-iron protein [Paenibacillus sp. LMG 31459]|jgi:regulator of cell morphogenesis and NO signaling|uniref:Iron-sulfur cluster repair di-iron protein n=1 Tax=Paenibacillus phytohabitans TaxID=2654978 RepID=A0ABX1YEQ8_9BACL|nr:iron-sulfur cluster repair di-iron protein [Paenibacillus phytohabitans]NOU78864.1 iron-sulfur cluster repair di-iron protein [Paenibacillus phytohabitans]
MASNQLNDITIQSGFTSEAMVRDIVLQFPKSADYFKAKRIDFCCGGAKPLAEAAAEKGLDPEAMIQDLNKLQEEHPVLEEDTAWNEASSEELVNYIVNKHHRYLREELPLISQNVTKVFRVHGEDSPHLGEMHRLFNLLREDLLQHTAKEEESEFPKMLAYTQNPTEEGLSELRGLLHNLEAEHDGAGEILRELRRVTNDYTPPAHACTTYRLTYARLEELEGMTFEHVHLENNNLFLRYQ